MRACVLARARVHLCLVCKYRRILVLRIKPQYMSQLKQSAVYFILRIKPQYMSQLKQSAVYFISVLCLEKKKTTAAGPHEALQCSRRGSKFLFQDATFSHASLRHCTRTGCQSKAGKPDECVTVSGHCARRFSVEDVQQLYMLCNTSTTTPCQLGRLTELSQAGTFHLLYYCTGGMCKQIQRQALCPKRFGEHTNNVHTAVVNPR